MGLKQKKSFPVFADYHQFYLWDQEISPEAPMDYTDEDITRRLKAAPNVVVVQPVRNMEVPVTVEVHDAEPAYDANAWDHIAECSLEIPSGMLEAHECTGGSVAEFAIPPGNYRVRAFFGNLDTLSEDGLEGEDRYTVVLWPAEMSELKVLKQWQKI